MRQDHRIRTLRHQAPRLLLATFGTVSVGGTLNAQTAHQAPLPATALVTRVLSYFGDGSEEVGSGIVVGVDARNVYIVTARHVVRKTTVASPVLVSFPSHPNDSIVATVSDSTRPGVDMAVLIVARDSLPPRVGLPALDRLANTADLRFGDAVSPMGCPHGECWGVPVPADRVVQIDTLISFQSAFVKSGSSGGGLFNRWWEIAGMVIEDEPPLAKAIPIDQVQTLARKWGYPASLRRAKVPRAGYRTHVGLMWLARAGSDTSSLPDKPSRVPSGRLVITRQGQSLFTWHLSGLRLAPKNLAVDAAMGGVGLDLHAGRFAAQPFIELGVGRVEGRFDAGGYYVAPNNDYVPFWNQKKQDGLGVGGGLSIQALILPHVAVEVLGGHWSFNVPDNLLPLPTFFVGAGLRLGL